jgi:6-phosphogluconolactonase
MSMTLGALLQSDEILLLVFGEEKLAVYEKAKAGDINYPIAALLKQQVVPVSLYWAP